MRLKSVSFCRPLQGGEELAVDDLLHEAFGGGDEAQLVQDLRNSGAMAGEMVLPTPAGEIVGYYALSTFREPKGWLCLAPVAVHPEWQRQGHGVRMVGQCSAWAEAAQRYVVVLGGTAFYTRAGFAAARAEQLQSPYPVEHTLLAGPGAEVPECKLVYPSAFGRN